MCFIENPDIMEFGAMKSEFCCTNLKHISSRKLLNLFFEHISSIIFEKIAIIVPMCFPMMFLCFSIKQIVWGNINEESGHLSTNNLRKSGSISLSV